MNRLTALLLLLTLLPSACGLAPTPAPAAQTSEVSPTGTMSETSEVLPTLTPSPAPTETPAPTPSLPPEALEHLKDRALEIKNGQALVGDAVWYAQNAEGQWQPAPFVADFEKFDFSLDGLEPMVDENGVVQIIDPNAANEAVRVVYENGLFYWEFAARNLNRDILMPTKYPPRIGPFFITATDEAKEDYFRSIVYPKQEAEFERLYGIDPKDSRWGKTGVAFLWLDSQKNAWGVVNHLRGLEDYNLPTLFFLIYETVDGGVVIVPLMEIIDYSPLQNYDPGKQ